MKPDTFQNRYRIAPTRLQNWDYGWAGTYFITICTQNRENYFGDIVNEKMKLSEIGIIANVLWYEIKNHAKNIELGNYIIMPNHIHGILILNNDNNNTGNNTEIDTVETLHATSLQSQQLQQLQKHQQSSQPSPSLGKNDFMSKISPKPNTISTIIRSYKSAVTKHAHRLGYDFAWQTRFYDHIIRDEKSYQNISDYIINNPLEWNQDTLNPMNLTKENYHINNDQWNRQ